jgi:hypothetical protein
MERGYVECDCGEFAHVINNKAAKTLPRGYCGELCPRCDMWMARIDKLEEPKEGQ